MTMDNCLNQVILFGPREAMDQALPQLKEAGGICLELPFGRAYHTEAMGSMARAFSGLFKDIALRPNDITLYSCATRAPFPGDEAGFRETIEQQYVTRVHFRETIERMHDEGVRYFIEVGPKSVLTGFVKDILAGREHLAVAANHHRRDDQVQLMRLLGSLFVHRHQVALGMLYPKAEPAPAVKKKGMELPSHVPFISFDETEAEALRQLLPTPAAAPAPAPAGTAPHQPTPQPAGAAGHREEAVRGHFELMSDFLRQQDLILGARQPAAAGPAERDWDRLLPLPFATAIHFLPAGEGQGLLQQVDGLLGPAEREQWPPAGRRKRQTEWLAGRAAVKEAVRRLCARSGVPLPEANTIELIPDENGRVRLGPGWPAACGAAPEVSISHLDGAAVGIAAPAGTRVGIDLEREGRIRVEPGHFAELAFTPAEQARLPRDNGWQPKALQFWTAKEAAAKALGVGLSLSPLSFEVVPDDNDHSRATVLHQGQRLSVCWTTIGNWLCSVAFHQATP
jgi:phosphopantetheinyl transferase